MTYSLANSIANGDLSDAAKVQGNITSLAADEAGRYRTIFEVNGVLPADSAAGTWFPLLSGLMSPSGTATDNAIALFYFDDADYTISGLTVKLRLRFQVAANATQPLLTFTAGLRPITVAGTTDLLAYTAGTAVSGSTVALASPAASTITQGNSGDFTIPADGAYSLAVLTSGTLTNNSAVSCHAQLAVRAV
jgi:hypothetical protein